MAGRHGETWVSAQDHCASNLACQFVDPVGLFLQRRDHRRMGHQANCSDLFRRETKQRSRFERLAIGGKLEKRWPEPGTYDLEEAETIYRSPFEGLG